MPWAAYNASGRLQIGFFDRSYDPANHAYGYTLASETGHGSLSFTNQQVTTTLSDPTTGDRWFAGTTVNPAFPHPTRFLGDYSNIAVTPSGDVAALWTDMRVPVTGFPPRDGSGEDAFFALVNPPSSAALMSPLAAVRSSALSLPANGSGIDSAKLSAGLSTPLIAQNPVLASEMPRARLQRAGARSVSGVGATARFVPTGPLTHGAANVLRLASMVRHQLALALRLRGLI
jgi:hypothetical protein